MQAVAQTDCRDLLKAEELPQLDDPKIEDEMRIVTRRKGVTALSPGRTHTSRLASSFSAGLRASSTRLSRSA